MRDGVSGRPFFTLTRGKLQEMLKEQGDWVEFPATVQRLAELMLEGRLSLDAQGRILLDDSPPGDLFLM